MAGEDGGGWPALAATRFDKEGFLLWPAKTGSFGKSVVTFCDPEKQLLSVIVRCAIGKLAGVFCSFLPSPI